MGRKRRKSPSPVPSTSSETTETESEVSESEEEDGVPTELVKRREDGARCVGISLDGVDGYEDVNVLQLCGLPMSVQEKVIEELRIKETMRFYTELESTPDNPESFSKLGLESFLKEAKFENRVLECRSLYSRETSTNPAIQSQVHQIATDADRRYVFEKRTGPTLVKNTMAKCSEKSSLGPSVGQMRPGESIAEACARLKKRKTADAPKPDL